jgi:hypothetical protein
MTGGNDSTTNLRTSELKLQEVRKDFVANLTPLISYLEYDEDR